MGRRGTLGGGGGRRFSTVTHLCTCLRGADALQIFLVNSKPEMSLLTKNFVLLIQELYVSSFFVVQDDKKHLVCEFLVAGEQPTGSALDQVLDCCGDGGGCGGCGHCVGCGSGSRLLWWLWCSRSGS